MIENNSFVVLSSSDKYSAIDELIRKAGIFSCLEDREHFIDLVHERERILSTGVGHGVAIAHGKLENLKCCHIALGWVKDGIYFDDRYPEKVRLLFVIASDPERQDEYLEAVSHILSWVHDEAFCSALKEGRLEDPKVRIFLAHLEAQEFLAME